MRIDKTGQNKLNAIKIMKFDVNLDKLVTPKGLPPKTRSYQTPNLWQFGKDTTLHLL